MFKAFGNDVEPYIYPDKNKPPVSSTYHLPPKTKPAPPKPNFPKNLIWTKEAYPFYDNKSEGGFSELVTNFSIRVTPKASFKTTVRNIFEETTITHTTGKESRTWLAGPNMKYWPQQLNFAVWAATKGCGVGLDMMKDIPFFRFHVAFTMRRLLYELACPLPKDSAFDKIDNNYDKVAWESLRNEFKLVNPDFRNKEGAGHGIGEIYVWSYSKYKRVIHTPGLEYPPSSPYLKFYEDGGRARDDDMIISIESLEKQPWKPFFGEKGLGLKNLSRINRSIEAFVYCILGAQANTRTPIYDEENSGGAQEAQKAFHVLFESSILVNSITVGIQEYQKAVNDTNVVLNYALAPGCWLMPSRLIMNENPVKGYDDKLRKVRPWMKFGVNEVNKMSKSEYEEKEKKEKEKEKKEKEKEKEKEKDIQTTGKTGKTSNNVKSPNKNLKRTGDSSHDVNLAVIAIVSAGVGWMLLR